MCRWAVLASICALTSLGIAQETVFRNSHVDISFVGQKLNLYKFENRDTKHKFGGGELFSIEFKDGTIVSSKDMGPIAFPISPEGSSGKFNPSFVWTDKDKTMRVTWTGLIEGSKTYFRQRVKIEALGKPLQVKKVTLIRLAESDMIVNGTVDGSPITTKDLFAGVEHPMSKAKVEKGVGEIWLDVPLPIQPGSPWEAGSVIGATPQDQLRRGFQAYLEDVRPRKYKTLLHYNSWYDIGCFNPYSEADAVDVIDFYGRELVEKRGVKMDSFLFDDGWDDPKTLWGFHSGFPKGFTPLKTAAAKYGIKPGVWMSPWGGYGDPRKQRLEYGKQQGFEIGPDGFVLSGPKYYERFEQTVLKFIKEYGVNQFKFDGTGGAGSVAPGSRFGSDFEAMMNLIQVARKAKPDIFINLTTGTWPSPFWTLYADSIWRGGWDHEFDGVGTQRNRWMTFRDSMTYQNIVKQAPLYPLNSLMVHGIIYAKQARDLKTDPGNDFKNEVRTAFGMGSQLQELYITPRLLTKENWDDLAAGAKWARANADIFRDVKWVGGSPADLDVYGWAAWGRYGILTLRNPSDKPQAFSICPKDVFELTKFTKKMVIKSVWDDREFTPASLPSDDSLVIVLKPFQVLNLEVKPS